MRIIVRRGLGALVRFLKIVHLRLDAALADRPSPMAYMLKPYRLDASTRIAHVNGNFLVGGTTQLMVDLIERLSDAYAQDVIVPDAPSPRPYQPVSLSVVPLEHMQPLFLSWFQDTPAAVHVQYWVREGDEYHPIALWYDAVFRMCERLGIPVIQNVNVPTRPHSSPAVVHNVYVSRYLKTEYDPGSVPSSVIYPGSDFTHFAAWGPSQVEDVIGMVYRLDPDKLNEQSIEVFIEVVKRRRSVRCLIVGGGHYLGYYRRRVSEEGLADRFTFTGYVSYADLPSYYRQMSLFIAPVHNESFGQVTPFAMSMGLPVAGFNVGALSEQLGGTDTLAAAGNVALLAQLIVELCEDRERRLFIGDANRRRAHDLFSVETMAARYRALYEEILKTEPELVQ